MWDILDAASYTDVVEFGRTILIHAEHSYPVVDVYCDHWGGQADLPTSEDKE